jgi:hypothetical protein
MDTLFLLAGLLGLGVILLARFWWRERSRRRTAEGHANEAIRQKYKLLDAIERHAMAPRGSARPVVVPMPATVREAREALRQIREQQPETGGTA